jgi:hypothetical protein
VFSFLIVAMMVGTTFHFAGPWIYDVRQPAGFVRGMVHGAAMPLAMPNLVVGSDVSIYADNNTGRTYKLGYTLGVNGCGLVFFGFFFWRLGRWRVSRKTS